MPVYQKLTEYILGELRSKTGSKSSKTAAHFPDALNFELRRSNFVGKRGHPLFASLMGVHIFWSTQGGDRRDQAKKLATDFTDYTDLRMGEISCLTF